MGICEMISTSIIIGITGLFVVAMILFMFSFVNEDSTVSIYLEPAEIKDGKVKGWHCVQCDWFWLRGMLSVIGCYIKWIVTFGRFKFDWESR